MTAATASCSVWGRKYQSRDAFFLSFFCAGKRAHSFSCLMECMQVFRTWIFARWCVYLYTCVCVCTILMMPSSATLLGCQHGAGDCHTQHPLLSKSCWDRSFFSVRTDDSHWHQIDPGHIGLIILCLHMSVLYRNARWHVQETWAENS